MSEIERLSSKPSFGARLTLLLGSIIFLHAAYSTYESVSVQKALGIAAVVIPFDIKAESVFGLFVVLLGTLFTASPLREITWASEYRKRTIDQIDARPSFVTLNHRGPLLFGTSTETSSGKQ
ncbi:uncharacterized protein FA14DRAFT_159056 [Meira miltonrushii]|uniref:Membrane magnesium transporter n=1 Tax=Meira miltonrushii TaxID=1280837 RepID=A0A316VHQ8_9BASI|nr:uncharacterized protein FA14DRAFT_159056 [Meira miltonrushii]PWN36568.1 hypothetical protein FA14DRAFT_159056 [Meira miltonrushii]